MAQGLIYMVDSDDELRRMTPSAPKNEDRMQELVAKYPELITDGDGELLLVKREQSITDGESGDGRWSLDHLFVTREAVPVLVELKRAVDTRLRRQVVGQLLDYAANATAYWQAGRIAESFRATTLGLGGNPEAILTDFIGERDAESFWSQVDANMKAGRVKLVFVADEIPRELARIVEFLNDQMTADVRAVELRWFSGDNNAITLSPRIIGETERAAAAKTTSKSAPISIDQWLEQFIVPKGDLAIAGAHAYIKLLREAGANLEVGSSQGSIYGLFQAADGKSFAPFHLWKYGALVSLSLKGLQTRPALLEESARTQLLESLSAIVGPMTTANLKGFPSFKVSLLANVEVASQVEAWLRDAVNRLR